MLDVPSMSSGRRGQELLEVAGEMREADAEAVAEGGRRHADVCSRSSDEAVDELPADEDQKLLEVAGETREADADAAPAKEFAAAAAETDTDTDAATLNTADAATCGDGASVTFVFRDERGAYHPVDEQSTAKPFSEAFCKRAAAAGSDNMKFLLDGNLLGRSQTPADVSLCDGAVIDCVLGQQGGCGPPRRSSTRPKKQVKLQYDFGHETNAADLARFRAGQVGAVGLSGAARDKKPLADDADVDEVIKDYLGDLDEDAEVETNKVVEELRKNIGVVDLIYRATRRRCRPGAYDNMSKGEQNLRTWTRSSTSIARSRTVVLLAAAQTETVGTSRTTTAGPTGDEGATDPIKIYRNTKAELSGQELGCLAAAFVRDCTRVTCEEVLACPTCRRSSNRSPGRSVGSV